MKPSVADPSCSVNTEETECWPKQSCSLRRTETRLLWKSCSLNSALSHTI